MSQHLPGRSLLVISDSDMYVSPDKEVFVYEPVLRELEILLSFFDKIVWMGCSVASPSPILTKSKPHGITYIVMPSVRNKKLNPLFVLFNYPNFLFTIIKYRCIATHLYTRAPSHPAMLAIALSLLDSRRKYWHKYAGDWTKTKLPFTYKLQRRLIKHSTRSIVTVNSDGKDNNHIHSFENPCIYEVERNAAIKYANQKDFREKLIILFVGRLMESKGILSMLEALKEKSVRKRIQRVDIIGEGPLKEKVDMDSSKCSIQVNVIGSLNRSELNRFYEKAHILILPSISEGFPKVIAEATAYGCIPVVTDTSVINKYIHNGENGFLLKDNRPQTILQVLEEITSYEHLSHISQRAAEISKPFTYEYFAKRVEEKLFE